MSDRDYIEEASRPLGGVVGLGDEFYVERWADQALREALLSRTPTITVHGPRQSGKSSLLLRGLHHARQHGSRAAFIDLQAFGADAFSSSDVFAHSLAEVIMRKLGIDATRLEELWNSTFGSWIKLASAIEDYILPEVEGHLVLAVDEADRIWGTDFGDDFFGLVRAMHSAYAFGELSTELTFVIVSCMDKLYMSDPYQSPFNVGLRLHLDDFAEEQVLDLNRRYDSPLQEEDVPELMSLLAGHPYLTRVALRVLSTGKLDWSELSRLAPSDQGPFGSHLGLLDHLLTENPDLRRGLDTLLRHGRFDSLSSWIGLTQVGLVKQSAGPECRCDLYRIYFGSERKRYETSDLATPPSSHPVSDRKPGTAEQQEQPESSSDGDLAPVSILFLSADPTDATRLRLGEEYREIQAKLQLAKMRDRFSLHPRMSVRAVDFSQALLDTNPQIVHFSGHGTAAGALCFENQAGEVHPIQPDALSATFEVFSHRVKCVILNACYSEAQARAIVEHIDCVIGMSQAIGDRAAIAFAIGFYQALGAGRSLEAAFKLGCAQIRLQNIPEHLTPILLKRKPVW